MTRVDPAVFRAGGGEIGMTRVDPAVFKAGWGGGENWYGVCQLLCDQRGTRSPGIDLLRPTNRTVILACGH